MPESPPDIADQLAVFGAGIGAVPGLIIHAENTFQQRNKYAQVVAVFQVVNHQQTNAGHGDDGPCTQPEGLLISTFTLCGGFSINVTQVTEHLARVQPVENAVLGILVR